MGILQVADFGQGRQQKEKQKLAHDLLGQGRREKQRLADQILGGGRKANAQTNGSRKLAGGTLASRVGVTKVQIDRLSMQGSISLTNYERCLSAQLPTHQSRSLTSMQHGAMTFIIQRVHESLVLLARIPWLAR